MIVENTNIGRRSSQPFERLEHIEPLEPDLYLARFLKVIKPQTINHLLIKKALAIAKAV
jgi:hypothetical protein